jgi:hypothetical protein
MGDTFELHLQREIDQPYESVAKRLRGGPEEWLPGFARDGDRVTGELAYERGGARIQRRTEVRIGPVQNFAYGVTVQVGWKGASHPELYPELEGHLRLEPARVSGSNLRLDARYMPPGGKVGASVDRALMHRVAESSVRDFLNGVAERLAAG